MAKNTFRDVTVEVIWPNSRVSLRHLGSSQVADAVGQARPDWEAVNTAAARIGAGNRPSRTELDAVARAVLAHAHATGALRRCSVVGIDCRDRRIWAGHMLRSASADE